MTDKILRDKGLQILGYNIRHIKEEDSKEDFKEVVFWTVFDGSKTEVLTEKQMLERFKQSKN